MFNLKKLFPAFLLLMVTSLLMAAAPYLSRVEFIAKYKNVAIREMERAHIPASITLGQAILESDGGNSEMAQKANSLFGIKCSNWDGPTYHKIDDDRNVAGELVESCFRKYPSFEESFIDHSDFLHSPNKPWYLPLFELELTDYEGWAHGLLEAGYASNPEYPQLLIGIIEKYRLAQFDTQSTSAVVDISTPESKEETVVSPEISTINGVKCTSALIGETVFSVAERTNTGTRQLIKYNDDIRFANQKLEAGQIVFLHAKKSNNRNTATGYHLVKEGDRMESIAQQYGIRLFWLYFKNKMVEGMEPAVGTKIKLGGITVTKRPALAASSPKSNRRKHKSQLHGVVDFEVPAKVEAKQKPLSKAKIKQDNEVIDQDFPSDELVIGAGNPRTHIVEKGETLWSISKTYKVDVSKLKELNDLSHNTLSVGQVIILE